MNIFTILVAFINIRQNKMRVKNIGFGPAYNISLSGCFEIMGKETKTSIFLLN
jgi:hypothetical protein